MTGSAVAVAVVAHEGGWDEILLVAGPIVLIVGILAIVKRRVDAAMPDAGHRADEPVDDQDRTAP